MTINLEDYIGKTVEVELRNGRVIGGYKIYRNYVSNSYKYTLGSYLNFYSQDGTNETHRNCDIIKIKEIKETPTDSITVADLIESHRYIRETNMQRTRLYNDAKVKGYKNGYEWGVKNAAENTIMLEDLRKMTFQELANLIGEEND